MDGVVRLARGNRQRLRHGAWVVMVAQLMWGAGQARGQATYYDRNEIPGHYTVGLYGDSEGTTHRLVLKADEDVVEAYLGITGDSTQVFSGMVFGFDLPYGTQLDGPIRWNTVPGLTQWGSPLEEGVRVEFSQECQTQSDARPLMLGRIRFHVDDNFRAGDIVVRGHRRWGVSVELCDPDRDWPKPFADPIHLTLERKRSFWSRVHGIFH